MAETDEALAPQRRRPILATSGWILFVCLFLPTLRVCGDPTMPLEFPPTYVAYLGAACIGAMALVTSLRVRRGWFTAFGILWYLTAAGWAIGMFGAIVSEAAGFVAIVPGLIGAVVLARRFHRHGFEERGMALGWALHGLAATAWNILLVGTEDRMWGAYVALAASLTILIAGGSALLNAHHAAIAKKLALEPAALPVARIVERSGSAGPRSDAQRRGELIERD